MTKTCTKCLQTKNKADDFSKRSSWCKSCIIVNVKAYQKTHGRKNYNGTVSAKLAKAKYRAKNRELLNEKNKLYQKLHSKQILAKTIAYQSRKINAVVKFSNLSKIKEIYKNCPKGFEVDHIIPLKGKSVSGLHVECNLQYLPIAENRSKSNKF